jgi:RNA polymerase sigma factor (sigma-70 family)
MDTQRCNPEGWQLPTLLGGPELNAFDAYRQVVRSPELTREQATSLYALIEDGKRASERFTDDSMDLPLQDVQDRDRIEKGQEAKRTLVAHHLHLITAIARRYANTADDAHELTAVGNLAIVEGVKGYIPRPDVPFASFATTVATNAMRRFLGREGRERTGLTRRMSSMLRDIDRAYWAAQAAGDTCNYMDVAEYLGFDEEDVAEALCLRNIKTVSFNAPITIHGTEASFAETREDKTATDELDQIPDRILLEKVWDTAQEMKDKELLNDREWFIFVSRFRKGMSYQAIGNAIGIAATGVEDWEKKTTTKIKRAIADPKNLILPEVAGPSDVERPIHLLSWLGIPTPKGVDPRPLSRKIIENTNVKAMTDYQRLILHKLLGTYGTAPYSVVELAKELGVLHGVVVQTRKRALNNILAHYKKAQAEEVDTAEQCKEILVRLGLPIPPGEDIQASVHAMIEGSSLTTERQRFVLHHLLGTAGKPVTVSELAKALNIRFLSVRKHRDRGVANILKELDAAKPREGAELEVLTI